MQKIADAVDGYEKVVAKATARFPERKEVEGHKRLYTPLDIKDFDYMDKLGFPGEYPLPAAYSLPCTAAACGRCALMQALQLPKKPMPVINTCLKQVRPVFLLQWTSRRRLALTVTTN